MQADNSSTEDPDIQPWEPGTREATKFLLRILKRTPHIARVLEGREKLVRLAIYITKGCLRHLGRCRSLNRRALRISLGPTSKRPISA